MILRDVAHDAESKTGTAGFTGPTGVDSVEAFEDALQVLRRYANAVVAYLDAHRGRGILAVVGRRRVVAVDRDFDSAVSRRVDDRILEQRVQGRSELAAVTEDDLIGLGLVEGDLDIVLFGGNSNPLDRLGDDE